MKNISISLPCKCSMQDYKNAFQLMQDGMLRHHKTSLKDVSWAGESEFFCQLLL